MTATLVELDRASTRAEGVSVVADAEDTRRLTEEVDCSGSDQQHAPRAVRGSSMRQVVNVIPLPQALGQSLLFDPDLDRFTSDPPGTPPGMVRAAQIIAGLQSGWTMKLTSGKSPAVVVHSSLFRVTKQTYYGYRPSERTTVTTGLIAQDIGAAIVLGLYGLLRGEDAFVEALSPLISAVQSHAAEQTIAQLADRAGAALAAAIDARVPAEAINWLCGARLDNAEMPEATADGIDLTAVIARPDFAAELARIGRSAGI